MLIERILIKNLKEYDNNAKQHPKEQIEQIGRKCFMMELDPKYVDVIINRWENYTGEKATRLT